MPLLLVRSYPQAGVTPARGRYVTAMTRAHHTTPLQEAATDPLTSMRIPDPRSAIAVGIVLGMMLTFAIAGSTGGLTMQTLDWTGITDALASFPPNIIPPAVLALSSVAFAVAALSPLRPGSDIASRARIDAVLTSTVWIITLAAAMSLASLFPEFTHGALALAPGRVLVDLLLFGLTWVILIELRRHADWAAAMAADREALDKLIATEEARGQRLQARVGRHTTQGDQTAGRAPTHAPSALALMGRRVWIPWALWFLLTAAVGTVGLTLLIHANPLGAIAAATLTAGGSSLCALLLTDSVMHLIAPNSDDASIATLELLLVSAAAVAAVIAVAPNVGEPAVIILCVEFCLGTALMMINPAWLRSRRARRATRSAETLARLKDRRDAIQQQESTEAPDTFPKPPGSVGAP